jgi:hypothetical protein
MIVGDDVDTVAVDGQLPVEGDVTGIGVVLLRGFYEQTTGPLQFGQDGKVIGVHKEKGPRAYAAWRSAWKRRASRGSAGPSASFEIFRFN